MPQHDELIFKMDFGSPRPSDQQQRRILGDPGVRSRRTVEALQRPPTPIPNKSQLRLASSYCEQLVFIPSNLHYFQDVAAWGEPMTTAKDDDGVADLTNSMAQTQITTGLDNPHCEPLSSPRKIPPHGRVVEEEEEIRSADDELHQHHHNANSIWPELNPWSL